MTQTLELTFEQARDGLRKAVETRGADFVYPDEWRVGASDDFPGAGYCVNFGPDNEPRCIVGFVLWLNGITPDTDDWRTAGVDRLSGRDGDDNIETMLFIDNKTYVMLAHAQGEQDKRRPWGDAVRRAEKTAEAHDRNQTGND